MSWYESSTRGMTPIVMYNQNAHCVGGVAQWLGRWSVAGGLSLIYA